MDCCSPYLSVIHACQPSRGVPNQQQICPPCPSEHRRLHRNHLYNLTKRQNMKTFTRLQTAIEKGKINQFWVNQLPQLFPLFQIILIHHFLHYLSVIHACQPSHDVPNQQQICQLCLSELQKLHQSHLYNLAKRQYEDFNETIHGTSSRGNGTLFWPLPPTCL